MDASTIFNACQKQLDVFTAMREVIAKEADKLTLEEKQELEGYVDNQYRQCELFLRLEEKGKADSAESDEELHKNDAKPVGTSKESCEDEKNAEGTGGAGGLGVSGDVPLGEQPAEAQVLDDVSPVPEKKSKSKKTRSKKTVAVKAEAPKEEPETKTETAPTLEAAKEETPATELPVITPEDEAVAKIFTESDATDATDATDTATDDFDDLLS